MIDWKETLVTSGTDDFIKPNYPKIGSQVTIKLKVFKDNPIEHIFIRIAPNGEEINIDLHKSFEDSFFTTFEVSFVIVTRETHYRFGISTDTDFYWLNAENKLKRSYPSDLFDFKLLADFDDPEWVKEAIFYQIFPDRFFDGDPSNNVKTDEYEWHGKKSVARKWNDYHRNPHDYPSLDFYGGDLEGIKQKIPYLKELGISAIYLNPIFHAPSNHKYDIMDYKSVDKHFGTNKEFAEVVNQLHKNGIKIILDGIFNHTGEGHRWFNRLNIFSDRNGAFNTQDSPFYDFYTFYDWPEDYHSWMGHKSLPKLNYNSDKLRQEIYKNDDSVIKYWLSAPYNIDGWRIDVANMLGRQNESQLYEEIWDELRSELKKCRSDAYLMGETFFDGTPLLDGKKLDAVMNYQAFNFPLLKWLTKKEVIYITENQSKKRVIKNIVFTVQDFREQLAHFRSITAFQLQLLSFNLLGSHDVPRFLTRLENNVAKFKLANIFLFTYIGVPSIYYGDEIGMQGSFDPDNRRPMIWNQEEWNQDIFQFLKILIKLRNSYSELKKGSFQELYYQDELFSYVRQLDENFTIVILNNNNKPISCSIPLWKIGLMDGKVQDYLSTQQFEVQNGMIQLNLKEYECLILRETF